jgi:CheY-like chemotaxis protein
MATSRHTVDDRVRVLFIENDPAVAEMYKLKLELDGYEVTIVPIGDEVTERAAAVAADLIFLDTQRHEDGGMATLRALRSAPATRNVPVIILSSQHANQLAASGFKADVMDYVVHADLAFSSLSRNVDEWAATVTSARS